MERKAAPTLGGKRLGVEQQFPKEIADRRKALFPAMRAAKAAGETIFIRIDKLYIDGELYRPGNGERGGRM